MKNIRYSAEQKQWALAQMKPPHNRSVVELARSTGITEVTLRAWRGADRAKEITPTMKLASNDWSSPEKFQVVLETATFNQTTLQEYCRTHALLPEQVSEWRQRCEEANESQTSMIESGPLFNTEALQQIRQLERELRRKNAALAEAATLLVLREKAYVAWGEVGDAD